MVVLHCVLHNLQAAFLQTEGGDNNLCDKHNGCHHNNGIKNLLGDALFSSVSWTRNF